MTRDAHDPEVQGSLYDKLGAFAIAAFVSAASFFVAMFLVVGFSSTVFAYRHFGGEGSAWLGISVGFPVATLAAVVAFMVTVRWRVKKSLKH
jgi:hypothetical protein